jgi:pimeloyl-ACP methyl ester carboxylesterase
MRFSIGGKTPGNTETSVMLTQSTPSSFLDRLVSMSKSALCTVALLIGVTATAARAETVPGSGAYPPTGKLVDIGGYKLHINATGKGSPTVVLIAGAGDFSFDWSLVQPEVSRFARVASYDRAGMAWSDPGPTPRTMAQEAYELHLLLMKAAIPPPYVLVGHSVGGLIARVYASQYPQEVAGMVLVDSTHEDTTLMYQGKLVRIRATAQARPVPSVQTMKSSPPKPPTDDDKKQAEFNAQMFGPPKIEPPFDKLPPDVQKMRLWMLTHPQLSAASDDYWPEELQAMYVARTANPVPLGDKPLIVLVASGKGEPAPSEIPPDEWKRLEDEKLRQKEGMVSLSGNHELIFAEQSGHHIQLDEPQLVIKAIQQVVESARKHTQLPAGDK